MMYQLVDKETNRIVTDEEVTLAPNGELYSKAEKVTNRFHIKRFTGQIDAKGTPIYQGDILCIKQLTFESSAPLPENLNVEFYGGMFQLFRGNECLMGLNLSYIEDGEVIGDIYRNPELVIWRASRGDTIKLVKDVSYGTAYGMIEIPTGTVLQVYKSNNLYDGVLTEEEVTLSNKVEEKSFQYNVPNGAYIILARLADKKEEVK